MTIQDLTRRIGEMVRERGRNGYEIETPLSDLILVECDAPTVFEASVYRPVVCLILQGEKETVIGDRSVTFHEGQSLIVSYDLPVVSRVTRASRQNPYRAIVFFLDLELLLEVETELGRDAPEATGDHALCAGESSEEFVEVLARYFALCNDPVEAKILAPLLRKEIHYRVLMAAHGGMLRRVLRQDSHANRISKAIEQIRRQFRESLAVPELAKTAGMSSSSFYEHFRTITGTTPLQYQKDMRLMEAKRLISTQGMTVSSTAFRVGYESSTQFSREYARKFGKPPRSDLARG